MSSVFVLPNDPDQAFYTFDVSLDGRLYSMRFKFNARDLFWYMDLSDAQSGEILRAGVKVVSQWDLLRTYKGVDRPAGNIVPVPQGEAGAEATALGDLGTTLLMTYLGES